MPYTGTEAFAEAFGCPVHDPGDDMPYARPLIHDVREIAGLAEPTPDAAPIARIMEIAQCLRKRGGLDALMQLPDVQSPVDIAALVMEKSEFLIAMLTDWLGRQCIVTEVYSEEQGTAKAAWVPVVPDDPSASGHRFSVFLSAVTGVDLCPVQL